MKFGFFALGCQRSWQSASEIYERTIEQAILGEKLGFDSIWLAEHHFTEYGLFPNPAVLGAAIARETSKIRIGIGISVLPLRDPRLIAEDYAMLDILSNGRLDFGVGRGYQPDEFVSLGVPQDDTRQRFAECLDIIEGLWTTDNFTYVGRYYQVENLTLHAKPVQDPPPIWMAAVSPDSFRVAGERGLPFISAPQVDSFDAIKRNTEVYLDALASGGGDTATADLPLQRYVYCGDTTENARTEPAEGIAWFYKLFVDRMASDQVSDPSYDYYAQAQKSIQGMEESVLKTVGALCFDTSANVLERVREFRDGLNCNYLMATMDFPGMNQELVTASMTRFAESVMPCLKLEAATRV